MNPLMQFLILTGVPFTFGLLIGYGLRSYVSLARSERRASLRQ